MARTIRAAAAQLSPVLEDADGTAEKVMRCIADAAADGVRVIVFPETFAPYYPYFPFVHAAAARYGLRLVGWSARGFDGVTARASDPAEVVRRIMQTLRPGGIALLHEGRRGPAGEAVNVRAMELLLAELDRRGWRAVLPEGAL